MLEKQKNAGYFCAHCHTPMVDNLQGIITGTAKVDPNDPKAQAAVGCTFCHSIESVHDGMPTRFYDIAADGSVKGPGRSTKTVSFHNIVKNELFDSPDLCSGCHGYLKNDKGVSICSLKEEEWDGKSTCQDCHMKEADGKPAMTSDRKTHRSHAMSGGHSQEMLDSASKMEIKLSQSAGAVKATVNITNLTAHKLPSTMPFRMVLLKVQAKDASGKVVWENFKGDPMKEDPGAVFMKVFSAGDKVGVPTWDAEKIAMDTRIPAGATITRDYTVSAPGVAEVEASLLYLLLPAPAVKQFNIKPDGYLEVPHPISQATAKL